MRSTEYVKPEWLTYEGAAKYSSINKHTIWEWCKDNKIISAKFSRRGVRVNRQSLDDYLFSLVSEDNEE